MCASSWKRRRRASASPPSGPRPVLLSSAPAAAERLHQVDSKGEARLAVAHEGKLGVVGGALGVEHFEIGGVTRFVAHLGELERVARRLQAQLELIFRGSALLDADQRVGHFAERGLDRALVAHERLLAACLGLLYARAAPAGVEDRRREAE